MRKPGGQSHRVPPHKRKGTRASPAEAGGPEQCTGRARASSAGPPRGPGARPRQSFPAACPAGSSRPGHRGCALPPGEGRPPACANVSDGSPSTPRRAASVRKRPLWGCGERLAWGPRVAVALLPGSPPHPELQGANSSGHPLVCSTYEVSNEGPGGRHTVLPGVWGCGGSGGGKRGSGRAGTRHQAPVAWLGWQGGVASPAVSAERTFLCSGPSVSPAPWGPPAPTTTGTRTSQDDCAQYPHRHESPKPHAQSPGACPGRSSWPQDRKRGAPSVPMHRARARPGRGPGEAVAGTGQPRRQQGGEW